MYCRFLGPLGASVSLGGAAGAGLQASLSPEPALAP